MIREHDLVALDVELPVQHLLPGDLGTVIHLLKDTAGYLVEFNTVEGAAVAVVELKPEQLHKVAPERPRMAREWAA